MSVVINGSAGVTTNSGAVYDGIQSATAQASTSGTSIDFTGIPSWVKRITVMFSGVSTSGTARIIVQLGTASSFKTSGYASVGGSASGTTGFITVGASASDTRNGQMIISNHSGNLWVETFGMMTTSSFTDAGSGAVTLDAPLTQLRITTVNGTDTFDAGSINILYE